MCVVADKCGNKLLFTTCRKTKSYRSVIFGEAHNMRSIAREEAVTGPSNGTGAVEICQFVYSSTQAGYAIYLKGIVMGPKQGFEALPSRSSVSHRD